MTVQFSCRGERPFARKRCWRDLPLLEKWDMRENCQSLFSLSSRESEANICDVLFLGFYSDKRGFVLKRSGGSRPRSELAHRRRLASAGAETGQAEPDWLSNRLLPNATSLLLLLDPEPHNPSPTVLPLFVN